MHARFPLRALLAIGALFAALALSACGGDSSGSTQQELSQSSSSKPVYSMSKAEIEDLPEYNIKAFRAPIPKKIVIKDLWKGSGVTVQRHDTVLVRFGSAIYGEAVKTNPVTRNDPAEYSLDEVVKGWKEGVPGMKVGGRRQLIVPNAIDYENGTVVYVIDLLAVRR
jgi:peptidylprolyl isomerase